MLGVFQNSFFFSPLPTAFPENLQSFSFTAASTVGFYEMKELEMTRPKANCISTGVNFWNPGSAAGVSTFSTVECCVLGVVLVLPRVSDLSLLGSLSLPSWGWLWVVSPLFVFHQFTDQGWVFCTTIPPSPSLSSGTVACLCRNGPRAPIPACPEGLQELLWVCLYLKQETLGKYQGQCLSFLREHAGKALVQNTLLFS